MEWISTEERLPEEGKYVLARHNRGTWKDKGDQENVNCVVVKLVMGISMADRERMEKGEIPSEIETGVHYDGDVSKPIYTETPRWKIYKSQDEHMNNLKPYYWNEFGPDEFFGQSITHWCEIPKPPTS